jgi:hypothetical protein
MSSQIGQPLSGDDKEFERQLKRFRMRSPGPLPLDGPTRAARGWPIAASLAVVAVAGVIIVWQGPSGPEEGNVATSQARSAVGPAADPGGAASSPAVLTIGDLTRALNGTPGQMDEVLTAASRRLLPDVERADSTLNRLAGL